MTLITGRGALETRPYPAASGLILPMPDHFDVLRQAFQEKAKTWTEPANFHPVGGRQFLQNPCSGSAELYIDLAAILHTGFAFDQALGGKAIHQSDRAVVRNLKLLRQFADRNTLAFGEALDSQQGLVLARRQPS